jgi:hypothetical protein
MLASLLPLLGACNMAVSETPMFSDKDAGNLKPRPGIWLAEDPDCPLDTTLPEAKWPECATWLVVKASDEASMQDGKGQRQEARYIIAQGAPPVVQVLWRDEAKDDGKTFYVFLGLEPDRQDGEFLAAASWEVKCGTQETPGSEIKPYPGISAECRPFSQNAVRLAAVASRSTAEMAMHWRWLRPAAD